MLLAMLVLLVCKTHSVRPSVYLFRHPSHLIIASSYIEVKGNKIDRTQSYTHWSVVAFLALHCNRVCGRSIPTSSSKAESVTDGRSWVSREALFVPRAPVGSESSWTPPRSSRPVWTIRRRANNCRFASLPAGCRRPYISKTLPRTRWRRTKRYGSGNNSAPCSSLDIPCLQ